MISWLAIAFAPSLPLLIVGRVLAGVSSSVNTANCSMLVAQYASTPRRGVFLSLFALMVGLGVLFCYTLGLGLAWRPICLLVPVLLLINGAFLLPLPESPVGGLTYKGKKMKVKILTGALANPRSLVMRCSEQFLFLLWLIWGAPPRLARFAMGMWVAKSQKSVFGNGIR